MRHLIISMIAHNARERPKASEVVTQLKSDDGHVNLPIIELTPLAFSSSDLKGKSIDAIIFNFQFSILIFILHVG